MANMCRMDNISDDIEQLGPILKARRKTLRLTQESVATAAGISRTHLSQIETTKAVNIELPTLLRLLRALSLSAFVAPTSKRPTLNQILREVAADRSHE